MTARSASPSKTPGARLEILSGPSGVGKSAVADRLLKDVHFGRAVTATTRAPRGGEKDGVDYFFLARDEFLRRVEAGWFLEHADVYGNLYGTPRSSVDAVLASGRHCVLVIDVQGAATLQAAGVDAVYVFLDTPHELELAKRLKGRGVDAPDVVAKRLAAAAAEREKAPSFDHVVVNHTLEEAAREVAALVGVRLA